ncbi:hypothetical protein LB506_009682 [Fusarium annulatum]|nr:hypothetical protein LB506_009682 [Fusarium annulatum]
MYRLLFYSSQRGIVGPGTTARPSLSLHSCDRPPSSARFLLCKQPANNRQRRNQGLSSYQQHLQSIALHFFLSTHVFLFFLNPLQQRTSRGLWRLVQKWRHMNDILLFVFFFSFSLSTSATG